MDSHKAVTIPAFTVGTVLPLQVIYSFFFRWPLDGKEIIRMGGLAVSAPDILAQGKLAQDIKKLEQNRLTPFLGTFPQAQHKPFYLRRIPRS